MSDFSLAAADTLARFWLGLLWQGAWQGGLALGVVWLLVRLWPAVPSPVRRWLWRLAFLKLALCLVWWSPVEVPVLAPPLLASGPAVDAAGALFSEIPAAPWAPAAGAAPRSSPSRPPAAPGWLVLGAAWLAGATVMGGRVLREVLAVGRLRRRAVPVTDEAALALLHRLAPRLGLRRVPRLLAGTDVPGPLLTGWRSPAIVLPSGLASDPDLELILAHELAHVRGRDLLWSWLPALLHALFWFHPLVWLAVREWRLADEIAADERALAFSRATPEAYGALLLRVARESRNPSRLGYAAVGVSESLESLQRRIAAMSTVRSVTPRRLAAWGISLSLAAGAALVPWRLTTRAAEASGAHPRTSEPPSSTQAKPDTGKPDAGKSGAATLYSAKLDGAETAREKQLRQELEALRARYEAERQKSEAALRDRTQVMMRKALERQQKVLQDQLARMKAQLQAERSRSLESAPTRGPAAPQRSEEEQLMRERLAAAQARLGELRSLYAANAPQIQQAERELKQYEAQYDRLRVDRMKREPLRGQHQDLLERKARFDEEATLLRRKLLDLKVELSFVKAELQDGTAQKAELAALNTRKRTLERVIVDLEEEAEKALQQSRRTQDAIRVLERQLQD